jgi:hypothetical protein
VRRSGELHAPPSISPAHEPLISSVLVEELPWTGLSFSTRGGRARFIDDNSIPAYPSGIM